MWISGLIGLCALLIGIGLGLAIAALVRHGRLVDGESLPKPTEVEVPTGIGEVLRAIDSAGVVVGPHDEVLDATPHALELGLARGSRVILSEALDLIRETRQRQTSAAAQVEVQLVSSDRRPVGRILDLRVAPLSAGFVLVLAEDLTTARRVEATRRDFVANVSHELKTPIGAISLLGEAIEAAADEPVAVRRFASRLGIESARLTALVEQINELSQVQATDPMSRAEMIEVDELLADAVDRCQLVADQRQVNITIAGETGLHVLGDFSQLSSAVENLVENALMYSDPGARVVVSAGRQTYTQHDWIEISVSDNGIGIPNEDLERIFERFYRVDYARSRANGGSGLGLSIVKHVVVAHSGEVTVWSQPGRGSTFTIQLPVPTSTPVSTPGIQELLPK